MNREMFWLFIAELSFLLLLFELLTEGMDLMKFFLYKGNVSGKVVDIEAFSLSRSRRLVEHDSGQGYQSIQTTQDKSVHYYYFLSPTFWLYRKKKVFSVIEWNAGNEKWKIHYPYARNWRIGDRAEIHYNENQPWKYAVRDKRLCRNVIIKCCICILLIAVSMVMFLQKIG